MKRKVKLSFLELESTLTHVANAHQILGGYGDPLPNGDCLFNLVAYMLDGHTYEAQCYKDELLDTYSFVQVTTSDGLPAYRYHPDDIVTYMALNRPGYHVSFGDVPNASNINSVLGMTGGKVGVSYNGHAYTVEEVNMTTGKVKLYDPSNPNNDGSWVDHGAFTGVYNYYQTSTTDYPNG